MSDRLEEIKGRAEAATLDWRIYGEAAGVQAVIQLARDDVPWLLAEVERIQAVFAWYAGIDSDDAAWDGLDKLWAEQGITAATWRQAIDEVAEQGREALRRRAKG